ncbi:MAG: hypothetical protein HXS41_05020 [Theionarchaea archaeon]|nr:hypothetical protein [Theionarchaea archaeon]
MYRNAIFKEIWNRSLSYIRPQVYIILANLLTIGLSALLPFLIRNFIDSLTAGTYSVLLLFNFPFKILLNGMTLCSSQSQPVKGYFLC